MKRNHSKENATGSDRNRKSYEDANGAPVDPKILNSRVLLRPREYAALTSTPLSSVYRYLATGQLRCSRLGSTIRIPVSEITSAL